MSKPSEFTKWPWCSVLQDSNAEQIAVNIMVILKRTGDTWRTLTAEEYRAERQKDGGFSPTEARWFEKVAPLVATEVLARKFSPDWAKAAGAVGAADGA